MQQHKKKIIVAISGASGAIYGYRILQIIAKLDDVESHLIISKSAQITIKTELGINLKEIADIADVYYKIDDIAAKIASGSYITDGMIIAPCSVKTLANIATGNDSNLLTRAADVVLKERRKLVLMVRETPLNLIHINNMKAISEAGAIIAPPVPAFYNNPESIDDIVNYSVARILDLFQINLDEVPRWNGIDKYEPC